ncbi:MAG: cobalamin-dependent protein [Nitrososphaerota archaeon]|nr:cobalamin-dependent protein [Candidatus Bathyarchaeota archaeon]MDW8024023.1 cobalamin-dependent protein [Nitrososphaerota archaeon]MDW8040584.1 cobalamin-dependent protein [Nitrososphaerota archaeon]
MSWLKAMLEKEPPEPEKPIGVVVIGNLEPDLHETPKEMVRKTLKKAGFKTVDLGKAVAPQTFASKAKEVNADIIAVSINIKPAKDNLPKLDQALTEAGLKGKVVLMIGGAAVKKEDADAIGALYGKSKEEAVAIAKKVIEDKGKKS